MQLNNKQSNKQNYLIWRIDKIFFNVSQTSTILFDLLSSFTYFYLLYCITVCEKYNIKKRFHGSHHGIVVNRLDFEIAVSRFKLQSSYYIYF